MTDDYELDLLIDTPPVAPTAEEYIARKDAIFGTGPRAAFTVADVLGPHGLLAGRIAGYEERAAQRAMADLVAECIARAEHAIVEAGTGTGKSFAYLVPIILSGHPAIVSTANKTLQAQLVLKDLPFLQALFADAGIPFTYCVAKGKQNYLCRAKLGRGLPSPALAAWAESTETGDIDAAPETLEPADVARLCAGDDCTGSRCRLAGECWYLAARRRRFEADIVVTNHAQLCQQLAHPAAPILPSTPVCVIDEAHQLEGYAVAGQSVDLSPSAFRGAARDFAADGAAFLEALTGGRGGGDDVLIPGPAEFPEGVQLAIDLELAAGDLEAARQYALEVATDADSDYAPDLDPTEADARQLRALAERVERLAAPTKPGTVRHIAWRDGSPVAKVTRFDVGELLAGLPAHFHTVVYTSATLATGPGDFHYFQARNGISRARTLCVPSPFDYQAQCLLYVPMEHGMPDPRRHRERFDHAVRRQMWMLVQAAGGGALLLFTSHAAMRAAAELLSAHLSYPVRRQGEAPRPALIDWLKGTSGAVLCATASFWEGVDVPGEALRLVAIDKLPFEAPGPVERARQEALGKRAFRELVVPEATLKLKQGFGRLIRRGTDRGVVAILDPRLWTERYGRRIVEALPDARVVVRIEDVREFYGEREEAAADGQRARDDVRPADAVERVGRGRMYLPAARGSEDGPLRARRGGRLGVPPS